MDVRQLRFCLMVPVFVMECRHGEGVTEIVNMVLRGCRRATTNMGLTSQTLPRTFSDGGLRLSPQFSKAMCIKPSHSNICNADPNSPKLCISRQDTPIRAIQSKPFSPKSAGGPDAESALLVRHIEHLHLLDRILACDPRLRLAALHLIDELFEHVSVRHPGGLARQIGELAARVLVRIGLSRLCFRPRLDHLAVIADDEVILDVDPVPDEWEEKAVHGQLALQHLLVALGKGAIWHNDFFVGDDHGRRAPDGAAAQRALGNADAAVGEAELGLEVGVAVLVRLVRECVRVAAQALHRLGAEEQSQHGKAVRTHGHHSAAGEVVVEVDIGFARTPPREHRLGVDVLHVGGIDQGLEELPRGEEPGVKGFEDDRGVGLRQFRKVEEHLGLSRIGHARLLEQDMLAGADGADGPLVMERVGERDVDGVNVWVIEHF